MEQPTAPTTSLHNPSAIARPSASSSSLVRRLDRVKNSPPRKGIVRQAASPRDRYATLSESISLVSIEGTRTARRLRTWATEAFPKVQSTSKESDSTGEDVSIYEYCTTLANAFVVPRQYAILSQDATHPVDYGVMRGYSGRTTASASKERWRREEKKLTGLIPILLEAVLRDYGILKRRGHR